MFFIQWLGPIKKEVAETLDKENNKNAANPAFWNNNAISSRVELLLWQLQGDNQH